MMKEVANLMIADLANFFDLWTISSC